MSRCQGSKMSGSEQTVAHGTKKKNEQVNMNSFPVHDCTQEQNSSPYFSSIVRQCKWPSLSRKIVKIQIMILPPW